ncbi:hypothetical protein M011DRAFT_393108 [Sporormia fimetaria CBS 119925]|uniref:Rhodopsin domain-containing protein n=1 Tax=Sporormia fimetaria CBS 119925 TaxID=1340428 RepID=A0A6A6VMK8_9PLEO|nr:hypothetical protein M011DRAFT_393108 [Sporormia fimetaria CBS 119925]
MAEGSRFAPITDVDQSGFLWITSILCMVYSVLIVIVRLHIKWNMYGADDLTAFLATFFQIGQVVPLFVAMKHGLGRSRELLDASSVEVAGKATFASQIFLILTLACAKGSVAALMLRLFTRDMKVTRKSWVLCHATIGLVIIWAIGSIVAVSVSCSPSAFIKDPRNQCKNQVTRWRVITTFNIVLELLLMLLPIFFIWPIQMKRYIKLQVVIAFGFRLPVVGFSAAHLYYVSRYSSSANVSEDIIPAMLYQQFELFWSLLAATMPTLKAFMRSFNSGFGMEIDLDGYGSAYGSHSHGSRGQNRGSYPLQSLQSATTKGGVSTSKSGTLKSRDGIALRGLKDKSKTAASVNSDGSQELIIQRDVQWSVYSEEIQPGRS